MRKRDEVEKNLLFSKEFLDAADQQPLVRMAIEGRVPEVSAGVQMKANQLLENVRAIQLRNLEILSMQAENIKLAGAQQQVNN